MARRVPRDGRVKLKLRKSDPVIVITGDERGKRGNILQVLPKELKVVVSGVNMVTKYPKRGEQREPFAKEMPIHISNVAYVDPQSSKPTRLGFNTEGTNKTRLAKRSGSKITNS